MEESELIEKEYYKELIIKMIKEMDEVKFLRQIYTIVIKHKRRTGI